MRRALYSILLTGLFLLMLSALVVSPESADPNPPMRVPADFHAAFRPLVSAILPDTPAVPSTRADVHVILSILPLFSLCAVLFTLMRDANGRVLCAARYENSVYQLFRPEVAGG